MSMTSQRRPGLGPDDRPSSVDGDDTTQAANLADHRSCGSDRRRESPPRDSAQVHRRNRSLPGDTRRQRIRRTVMANNVSLLQTEVVAQKAISDGPSPHDSPHAALPLQRSIGERQHHVDKVQRTNPDGSRRREPGPWPKHSWPSRLNSWACRPTRSFAVFSLRSLPSTPRSTI